MNEKNSLLSDASWRRIETLDAVLAWMCAVAAVGLLAGILHEPLFDAVQEWLSPATPHPNLFYANFGVILAAMAIAFSRARNKYSTIFSKIALFAAVFTLMPYIFHNADQISPFLFKRDTCEPTLQHYALYVADNVAKGFIVDVLESYRVNLWELRGCEPSRSFFVGTLSLLIRLLVSFGVIYLAVTILKRYGYIKAQDAA